MPVWELCSIGSAWLRLGPFLLGCARLIRGSTGPRLARVVRELLPTNALNIFAVHFPLVFDWRLLYNR